MNQLFHFQYTFQLLTGLNCFFTPRWELNFSSVGHTIMWKTSQIICVCLQILNDWLEDSRWKNALVQAGIIHASHVTNTHHTHQVSAANLYKLLHQACNEHCTFEAVFPTFEDWYLQRDSESVHFDYWLKTLVLEVFMLLYIRSLRESSFQLYEYVETIAQLLLWIIALDHTHYSRWLSVYVHNMMVLYEKHLAILGRLNARKFAVHKRSNKFL